MIPNPDKVLSASRRTDIPAFYMAWFMEQIHQGFFDIKNPFTKITTRLDLSREKIHSIVFWSKNYDTFIRTRAGETLQEMGYHLYFNFTVNCQSAVLEPKLPPLEKRLEHFSRLSDQFGAQSIAWRFDPICFYQDQMNSPVKNNLSDFSIIAKAAKDSGISKCVTSFCDPYPKIKRRVNFLNKKNNQALSFSDPTMNQKKQTLKKISAQLKKTGIKLHLCCEKSLFSALDDTDVIFENACVDGKLLQKLFGGTPETRRDYGQRSKKGCKCTKSIDVGSYDEHPCFHDCLFCYANPHIDTTIRK